MTPIRMHVIKDSGKAAPRRGILHRTIHRRMSESEDRRSSPGAYEHKFGGYPKTITKKDSPVCGNCRAPLILLLQLDCSDPLLKSYDFTTPFVYIYDCFGCRAYWGPLQYRITDDTVRILHQETGYKWRSKEKVLPAFPVRLEELSEEEARSAYSHYGRDSGWGNCHYLGVKPRWIQRSARPDCVGCGKKMVCIGQLDSDLRKPEMVFDDMGSLYVLRCKACDIFGVVVQCH